MLIRNQEIMSLLSFDIDRFIVDESNNKAFDACEAIEKKLYQASPLLIKGEVGNGKTHLIKQVAINLVKQGKEVIYVSGERLVLELLNCIERNETGEFYQFFDCDLLIIDNFEYTSGKPRIQKAIGEELELLYKNKTQIIIATNTKADVKAFESFVKERIDNFQIVHITKSK